MYRLLIFTVLLTAVNCGRRVSSCHTKSSRISRNPEAYFHKLAHQAIWTEKKFADTYKHNACVNVREVFDANCYVLKYPLRGFGDDDVTVKVLHKTVLVNAECKEPKMSFSDVKMLPDNLNAGDAVWCLTDGELQITFPYQTPLGTEVRKACGDINYSVITVPKAVPAVEPECESMMPVF